MQRYYIFDWDGVFADSFNASVASKQKMDNVSHEEAIRSTINYASVPHNHTRTSNQIDIDRSDIWTERFARELINEEIPLFQEFIEQVKSINSVQCAIVSSGPGIVIRKLLRDVDIDFSHVLAYEDHHSKEEKIELICKDWGINIDQAYYFTDTKTDVWELSNIMDTSKIIGCSWGYLGYDQLLKVLPDKQILQNFKDIHKLP